VPPKAGAGARANSPIAGSQAGRRRLRRDTHMVYLLLRWHGSLGALTRHWVIATGWYTNCWLGASAGGVAIVPL
jgi:hypothetical protein